MKVPREQLLAAERDAAAAKPRPLPRPEGERRVQAALDNDKYFRLYLLACFVIAAAAGSGFGRLVSAGTWVSTVLWSVTAAGLAARCIGPANASSYIGRAARILTLLSGVAYACFAWRRPSGAPAVGVILAAVVIATLDVLTARRRSFAAIVAAVAAVQLGALPPSADLLKPELPLQLLAVTLEFLLLTLAGFRYALASLWRLPTATYRLAPLCIVPRLNSAWDHPVKINVV